MPFLLLIKKVLTYVPTIIKRIVTHRIYECLDYLPSMVIRDVNKLLLK
jgi:hypothetical protein